MKLKERFSLIKEEIKVRKFVNRRGIQRLAIKIMLFLSISNRTDKSVSTIENGVINVCRRLLKEPDTELSMTPTTFRRSIKNKRLGIKVIVKNMSVTVYQNKTSYPTLLSDRKYNYLINIFDTLKETHMDKDEFEIEMDVKNSIKTMYDYIVDNSTETEIKK